ncbi:MAG TPA: PP0621 family protein [Methylophilaceae bacterium]|nr:PP0621 family protein [Methylophilaceae bacterium]
MGKILLIAIIVWLILVILKHYRASLQQTTTPPNIEDMVQCATCGLHLPKSDSLAKNNRYYCCNAHLTPPSHKR